MEIENFISRKQEGVVRKVREEALSFRSQLREKIHVLLQWGKAALLIPSVVLEKLNNQLLIV